MPIFVWAAIAIAILIIAAGASVGLFAGAANTLLSGPAGYALAFIVIAIVVVAIVMQRTKRK